MANITALPSPPSTLDPANFATKADAFVAALALFVTEANTLATQAVNLGGGNLTGVLGFVAGAVGAPSLFPVGDTNTGLWAPAADELALSLGGVKVMHWNAAGFGYNMTPANIFDATKTQNAASKGKILNSDPGNVAQAHWQVANGTYLGGVYMCGTGHQTSGPNLANRLLLDFNGPGGIALSSQNGSIYCYASNTLVLTIESGVPALKFESVSLIANGAVATVLGSLGPTGASTTVQEWLKVRNASSVVRYIPMF